MLTLLAVNSLLQCLHCMRLLLPPSLETPSSMYCNLHPVSLPWVPQDLSHRHPHQPAWCGLWLHSDSRIQSYMLDPTIHILKRRPTEAAHKLRLRSTFSQRFQKTETEMETRNGHF